MASEMRKCEGCGNSFNVEQCHALEDVWLCASCYSKADIKPEKEPPLLRVVQS